LNHLEVPAVNLRRKNAVFTEPVLVAEVEYRTWTGDGKLRHPSFNGIRGRGRMIHRYFRSTVTRRSI
jgi:ATP-dependent DNA ligase